MKVELLLRNWQVLAEYDKNQSYIQSYIWGNYIDELLVKTVGTMPYNLVHDHLHSPVALLHVLGSVMERYEYDAYGNPTIMDASYNARNSSNYGNNYLFTGRSVDILDSSSLKIQHNRNRDYDYYTARWLTHDPLGITPNPQLPNRFDVSSQYTGGLSLYEYVGSNPTIKSDSQGLFGLLPITLPSLIANQSRACCKGISKTQVYMPLPGGGAYPRPSSECSQVTIFKKRFDQTAQQACDCYAKERKNFNVYEAHDGQCCECRVYTSVRVTLNPFPHGVIIVECDDNKKSFSAEVNPNSHHGTLPGMIGVYPSPVEIYYGDDRNRHKPNESGWITTYGYTVSCKQSVGLINSMPMNWHWSYIHNCFIFTLNYSGKPAGCP